MDRGKFVVIEGGDGVGKSTLVEGLRSLYINDPNMLFTRTPGGTPYGRDMREMILFPAEGKQATRLARLYMYMADMVHTYETLVLPALEQGVSVVCDRWWYSTFCYQSTDGICIGQDLLVEMFENSMPVQPDLVIWLDLDPEIAMGRVDRARGEKLDIYESKGIDFHRRVYKHYEWIMARAYRLFLDSRGGSKVRRTPVIDRELLLNHVVGLINDEYTD